MIRTTSPSNILYADRSGIETDWKCGMAYWWNRKEGGSGIVPVEEPIYFEVGRQIHDTLSAVAEGVPYQDILAGLPDPSGLDYAARERDSRLRGWIIAFAKYIWPRWSRDFEMVKVEGELILDRSPLWIAYIPDLVLRGINKSLDTYGKLVYKEYKTTGNTSPSWVEHWDSAVQVHLGLKGLEEETGEPVAYGQIVGLPKGDYRKGRLMHPFVHAYVREDWWQPEYKYGLDIRPVWEYDSGIEGWIERCGEDFCAEQFVSSAPIFLDPRLVEGLVRQRVSRELVIRAVEERAHDDWNYRELAFPQNFSACKPYVGPPCQYRACCFNKSVQDDPMGSGLYVKRTPHHEVEITLQKEASGKAPARAKQTDGGDQG